MAWKRATGQVRVNAGQRPCELFPTASTHVVRVSNSNRRKKYQSFYKPCDVGFENYVNVRKNVSGIEYPMYFLRDILCILLEGIAVLLIQAADTCPWRPGN